MAKTIFKVFLGSLFAYACSFIIIYFFAAAGHGSYAPLAIIYGWFSLPWIFSLTSLFDSPTLNTLDTNISFYILTALQFVVYGIIWIILKYKNISYSKAIILPGIHVAGALIASIFIGHGHLTSLFELILSYIVSILAIAFYWFVYVHSLQKKPLIT